MEKADEERTPAGETTSGEPEQAVKRPESIRTHVAHDGSLEPRPAAFDGIQLGGIGRQPNDRQPVPFALDELTRGHAAMGVDAVPNHDERAAVVLMQVLQETDDVFGTNRTWNQGEEEPDSTRASRVGHGADCRQILPVAQAVTQDRGLPPGRPGPLDRRPFREAALVDEDDRGPVV